MLGTEVIWNKDRPHPFIRTDEKQMVLSQSNVSIVAASLGAAIEQTCHLAGWVSYSGFQTHSWCGAPVFVSRVRTKNMKMTKTARPTQNPITMESGERQKTRWSVFHLHLQKVSFDVQHDCKSQKTLELTPEWQKKGQSDLSLSFFTQKATTEARISSSNFTDVSINQKQAQRRETLNSPG